MYYKIQHQTLKIHIKSIGNVNKTLKVTIKVGMNRKASKMSIKQNQGFKTGPILGHQ